MEYALLVYRDAESGACDTEARPPAFLDDPKVRSFIQLRDVDVSTTVRVKESRTIVSDGPFAETKEVFGGIIVIDARDMDDALAFAAKAAAAGATIEVRPTKP